MDSKYIELTDKLLEALGMSKDDHSQLIFDRGVEYFTNLQSYEPYRQQMLHSEVAWNWWKEQWYRRNNILLVKLQREAEFNTFSTRSAIQARFYSIHNVERDQLYPSKALMQEIVK